MVLTLALHIGRTLCIVSTSQLYNNRASLLPMISIELIPLEDLRICLQMMAGDVAGRIVAEAIEVERPVPLGVGATKFKQFPS